MRFIIGSFICGAVILLMVICTAWMFILIVLTLPLASIGVMASLLLDSEPDPFINKRKWIRACVFPFLTMHKFGCWTMGIKQDPIKRPEKYESTNKLKKE
jgi:hypothetical protein